MLEPGAYNGDPTLVANKLKSLGRLGRVTKEVISTACCLSYVPLIE